MSKEEDLSHWEPDQCDCGDDLYFVQDKRLQAGHIWEGQEMFCGDDLCDLVNHVYFNDDGSSYSDSYDKE
ncbi:MAG TPA: hypothetical protein EYN67_12250 [Flavobacteriales bacterium]|nr:hypothetical protein [Flavobacteriales bacterium]